MIRSLVIRQIFRFLDIVLIFAVVIVGGMVIKLFLSPIPQLELPAINEEDGGGDPTSVIQTVQERTVYEGLSKSGMFGAAGRWDVNAPAPAPEPQVSNEIEESQLSLKLRGTIALKPGDPFSAAFIENTEKKDGVRSYLLGQEVVDNVFLDSVEQREVILLNKSKNPPQKEILRMEEYKPVAASKGQNEKRPVRPGSLPPPPPPKNAPARPANIQHIKVNREAIIKEALENYSQLATITPEVKTDESGKVLGLTAQNISKYPMAKKLGFQDGDVLQTINNEPITSREQLLEIFQRYQNARAFRIGILRDGKPSVLMFDVE